MDEAFWANVVKRWSEASDNVLKLKEELARLQSEVGSSTVVDLLRSNHDLQRFLYRNTAHAPQRHSLSQFPTRDFTRIAHENLVSDNRRKDATDELLDAEAGLSRAKEEYRRLQQEVWAGVLAT